MAQRDVTQSPTYSAGFEYAKRLRDPAFRELINRLKFSTDRHVVMASDDEPVVDIVTRIMFHETHGRVLIAIPDENESFGFRLLSVEVVTDPGANPAAPLELAPGASIGMLYSHLQPCGTYIPSEWSRSLLFEKFAA